MQMEYSDKYLWSAFLNTFTTYKHAIVILRYVILAIFSESNCSFYTFDPHAKISDDMPYSYGTATVFKFGDLSAVGAFYVLYQIN